MSLEMLLATVGLDISSALKREGFGDSLEAGRHLVELSRLGLITANEVRDRLALKDYSEAARRGQLENDYESSYRGALDNYKE